MEAGAEIAQVVGVDAVDDGGEAALFGEGSEARVKLSFAVVAAVGGVGGVAGVIYFVGIHQGERGVEESGEFFDALEFAAGEGGTDTGGGQDALGA